MTDTHLSNGSYPLENPTGKINKLILQPAKEPASKDDSMEECTINFPFPAFMSILSKTLSNKESSSWSMPNMRE